jgi:hypothetical protein
MGKKSHHPIEGFPGAVHNSSLFSDYFLAELIKEELFFQLATREAKEVCEEVRALYERVKSRLPEANEAETERLFIRPVLDILGWKDLYTLQPSVPSYEGTRRPDFCFFVSKDDLENAERHHKGRGEYFSKAVAIGDAKQWSRSLDTKLKGPGDRFANHYPPYQIDFYLRATDRLWGILTNGRHWRLYHRDTSYKLDIYYEVDVATILEEAPEAFPYFWAFFSRDAFTTGFLDSALKDSQKYAARLGEELKDNVYEALRLLAEGLLKNPENGLSAVDLEDIRTNTFVLIYRILFLLYAEDRGLLPMENPTYRDSYSLRRIASEIAKHLDNGRTFSPTAYRYWMALSDLFRIVNEGDAHLGVPPYNGGLFDPEKHPLLARWKIGDQYLALAIDKLARAKAPGRTSRGPVSYRDLNIQHLGAIYEGLLEHRLAVASEDLAVIKDGSKEIFVPLSKAKGNRPLRTYRAGEVYLQTDKGERKATGSYYTPNYIVEYIVQHTLGPLVEEKKEEVTAAKRDLDEKIKHARGYDREVYQREREKLESGLINKILSIKVLDPAMGSGHFLVEAVDFLARALIEALGESPKEVEEDVLRWARREVVERCIFGVDVNPLAVELAKLSLWLYTVAKDRPLSFLDHHLRVGNSLIGAWIKDLGRLPPRGKKDKAAQIGEHVVGLFEGKLKERLPVVLGEVMKLLQKPSDKVEHIREKEALYDRILALLRPFKEVANVWVSTYFGNEVDETSYENVLLKLSEPDTVWEAEVRSQSWFANAQRIAEERHFFHWELEFPEVFFEETGQRKHNPGFDAVIGNPPYEEDTQPLPGGEGKWQTEIVSIKDLGARAWTFALGPARSLLKRLSRLPRLEDIATVFKGTGTSADEVFLMERRRGRFYSRSLEQWVEIEDELMRPSLTGQDIDPYYYETENYLLFPYRIVGEEAHLIQPEEMAAKYPKAWTYLNHPTNQEILRGRDKGAFRSRDDWYAYGRPQNMHLLKLNKVIGPDVAGRAEFTCDFEGRYVIDTVYAIRPKEGVRISLLALAALLNSPVMTFFLQQTGTKLRGGYFRMKTAYLNPFPIPRIAFVTHHAERARLVEEGKQLYWECLKRAGLST